MLVAAIVAVTVASCGGAATETTAAALLPDVAGTVFVADVDNQYWPLVPGSRWTYEGEDQGEPESIVVTVEDAGREVMGVATVVVHDVVATEDGVVEDTLDWYAQDDQGNVWYMGEDSKEIQNGEVVAVTGSWEAGVGGAVPGIIMWGDPAHLTGPYYQEFDEGVAEDKAEFVRIEGSVTVAAGTFTDVLVTREWNPLEPGTFELKYYAPGVGLILEVVESGGDGRIELVSFTLGG